LDDGSALSDEHLWTLPLFDELVLRFVDNPDESQAGFVEKLGRQLADGSPQAKKLMAELLWILNLFPSNIGPTAKRRLVMEVWDWSGDSLGRDHPMLQDGLLEGMGSAGPGFLAHRWREVRFAVNAMRAAKRLSREGRQDLLLTPWGFAEWLDAVPDEGYRQFKLILPFLMFPDHFERIASPGDIRNILTHVAGVPARQVKQLTKVDRDQRLFALREQFEEERGEPIDFYDPEFRDRWSAPAPATTVASKVGRAGSLNGASAAIGVRAAGPALNRILYGPPGTGKTFRTVDCALEVLDPAYLRDNCDDRDALKARFDELVGDDRIHFVTFHQSFSYEDFVEGLRAEARPDGAVHYCVADGIFKSICGSRPDRQRLTAGTELGGYEVLRATNEILWLRKPNGLELPLPWAILDELRAHVLSGRISIADIRAKTVFDAVPESLLEKYIVNGYNNVLPHVLEAMLPDGIEETGSEPRVLIIDEINRGNISKIFGELITLIEPSKRAGSLESLSVILPYSKSRFEVPANLYIVGTMNTADRSLAAVDIALRRRFHFEEVAPDAALLDGVEIAGIDIGALLRIINARIEVLLDREHRIGHAYFMGLEASDDIAPLRRIFEAQIIPLLEEYFFEDWQRIRLVLNDHRKDDPDDRFVIERLPGPAELLGHSDLGVPVVQAWQINRTALDRPSAFARILG